MVFLNDEILDIISSYLTQRELKHFSRVNKRFRGLALRLLFRTFHYNGGSAATLSEAAALLHILSTKTVEIVIPLVDSTEMDSPMPEFLLHNIHTFYKLQTVTLQSKTLDARLRPLTDYLAMRISRAVMFRFKLVDDTEVETLPSISIPLSLDTMDPARIQRLHLETPFLDHTDHLAILSLASLASLQIVSKRIFVQGLPQSSAPPSLRDLTLQIQKEQHEPTWISILQLTRAYCTPLQCLDLDIMASLALDAYPLQLPNLRKLRLRLSAEVSDMVTNGFFAVLNAPRLVEIQLEAKAAGSHAHPLDPESRCNIPRATLRFPVLQWIEFGLVAETAKWAIWLDRFIGRARYWEAQKAITRLRIHNEYPWDHELAELHKSPTSNAWPFEKRLPNRILALTLTYLDLPGLHVSTLESIEVLHLSSDGTARADRKIENYFKKLKAPNLKCLRLRGSEGLIMRCVMDRPDLALSLDVYLSDNTAFKRDRLASMGRQLMAAGHLPSNLKAITSPSFLNLSICGEDLL